MKNILLVLAIFGGVEISAAEPVTVTLTSPKPYQVVQRVDVNPDAKSAPGGHADVLVAFDRYPGAELWEYRTVLLGQAKGRATDWTPFTNHVRIAAGGWYRLEIRARSADGITHRGSVEPVGVGEVLIVAGQSYATNCNDEKLKPSDPRVVAFDSVTSNWVIANDPQPVVDQSDGGSIWPPLGDALAREFGVPIAFANVAVGGTSSQQWMPGGALHQRLVQTGRKLVDFRAVLWQQGESDVIAKTTTAQYVENLKPIRRAACQHWQRESPWLLAKSTLHPTVYNDPKGEGVIRSAIDELVKLPGFRAGPDTDTLAGEHRGGPRSRRHFSPLGQKRAAEMWFSVIRSLIQEPVSLRQRLHDLKLLEPVWASATVHRESSILLTTADGRATARLAFPAARLMEVATADRQHLLTDAKLSADGLTVTFPNTVTHTVPLQTIAVNDLFPPSGSPNSYKHRQGHPDQNLLYRPGRWFHDHNIELTYMRREMPRDQLEVHGTLPKTIARLKSRQPMTIGISGDSISTGLDASAKTNAFPNQPGYPELVAVQLETTFDTTIRIKNRAVAGWSVANGVNDLDQLLAEKPDLVIVAYGMNDVGRRDPDWFLKQTKQIVERIRTSHPQSEVILVSPMLGHAEWIHTPRAMFGKYRDSLRSLTGPGVALADVTAVWELLLKNKHDLDMTGNGLNHPNDFGHRLYAQTILALLCEAPSAPRGR